MMRDLGRALAQASASSTQVGEAIRRIHRDGYSLYLVLDGRQKGSPRAQLELKPRRSTAADPSFRLATGDVVFLKSIGIDPTRPARRRRG